MKDRWRGRMLVGVMIMSVWSALLWGPLPFARTPPVYWAPDHPAAVAARQLETEGRSLRPGQTVRLLYTRGEPGVHAWDLSRALDPATLDQKRYAVLLGRAAATILDLFPARTPPGLFSVLEQLPGAPFADRLIGAG
jgi:hypothetical protein